MTLVMPSVSRHFLANYVGKLWSTLLAFAVIPVYIQLMGIEGYGLVGFFVSLQAILGLLDLGLTTTLNRELARSTAGEEFQSAHDIVATLEGLYAAVAILITSLLAVTAPLVARHWVNSDSLSNRDVTSSVALMGVAVATQWTTGFYSGGLLGLERHVAFNVWTALLATLRAMTAVAVLAFISASPVAFFAAQAGVGLVGVGAMRAVLLRSLPPPVERGQFRVGLVKTVWKFAAGMSANSVLGLLLFQLDKVLLVKLLSLKAFGFYAVATSAAAALGSLAGPILISVFPRFVRLLRNGEDAIVRVLYHRSAQALSVVVIPAASTVAVFSSEVLAVWTRNPEIVRNSHVLLSVLVAGYAINAIVSLPNVLQVASGWTSLSVYANLIAVVILVPAVVYGSLAYGAAGAALVWLALNCGYFVFYVYFVHRRLLPLEKYRWYIRDVGIPALVSVGIALAVRFVCPVPQQRSHLLALLAVVWFVQVAGVALVSDGLVSAIRERLNARSQRGSSAGT